MNKYKSTKHLTSLFYRAKITLDKIKRSKNMQILLDTANIETIKRYNDIYNIAGVTTNPTIISREGGEFFQTLLKIREVIGNKQLHVQVTSYDSDEMVKEAEKITDVLGKDTYIKIPAVENGIRAIKILKEKNFNVTATVIFSLRQAAMAANVGADYVAPYFNRISSASGNAEQVISDIAKLYSLHGLNTKILVASFRNTEQIMQSFLSGADAVTCPPEFYTDMLENPFVDSIVERFSSDWKKTYGDKNIFEL